jgi:hypothetical protein
VHCATSRKVARSSPDEVTKVSFFFFNLPNSPSRTTDLGFTQPLLTGVPEDSTGSEERPASKAVDLTVIYEPTVWTMRDSRHLTPL